MQMIRNKAIQKKIKREFSDREKRFENREKWQNLKSKEDDKNDKPTKTDENE